MQNFSTPKASRNPSTNGVRDGKVTIPTQKIPADNYPITQGKGTGALKNIPGFTADVKPGKI